jgi:hypothetical protein
VTPPLRVFFCELGVGAFTPDDIVHERAAPGDAAMKLCRDQTGLLSHDRELLFLAVKKIIDLIGRPGF